VVCMLQDSELVLEEQFANHLGWSSERVSEAGTGAASIGGGPYDLRSPSPDSSAFVTSHADLSSLCGGTHKTNGCISRQLWTGLC